MPGIILRHGFARGELTLGGVHGLCVGYPCVGSGVKNTSVVAWLLARIVPVYLHPSPHTDTLCRVKVHCEG
jgi:hypothetical protein